MGMKRPARRRIDESRSTDCEIAIDADIVEPLSPGEPVMLKFSLTPAPVYVLSHISLQKAAGQCAERQSDVNLGGPPRHALNSRLC